MTYPYFKGIMRMRKEYKGNKMMKRFAISDVLYGHEIKTMRKRLGYTQADFARLVNVTVKTVERWESGSKPINGPVVTLLKMFDMDLDMVERLEIPEKKYPMRLYYMHNNDICTVIDVDVRREKIAILNYTEDRLKRAFGKEESPDYKTYEEFLESRCFPRSRDKMKLILKDLDLPFYDPLLIIEKTEGRMAEDKFWIKIER